MPVKTGGELITLWKPFLITDGNPGLGGLILIPLRWSLCRFLMSNHMKQPFLSPIICVLSCILFAASPCGAEKQDVQLRGQVIDIMTQPVAGAEVYLYDSKQVKRPADYISQKTKIDGEYRMTVPPGVYWAVAIMRQSGSSFGPLQVGDKHSGEPLFLDLQKKKMKEIDFTIMDLRDAVRHTRKRSEELFEIRGRILDTDEKPVAMAYVLADTHSTPAANRIPQYLSAWTDIDGKYIMYLPAGEYYLGASTAMPPSSKVELSHFIKVASDMQGVDLVFRGPRK